MSSEAAAIKPLMLLGGGVTVGTGLGLAATAPGPRAAHAALVVLGAVALALQLSRHKRAWAPLWLIAGMALGTGSGLAAADRAQTSTRRLGSPDSVVRIRAAVIDGWRASRWGRRATVQVRQAWTPEGRVPMPGRCSLEVRGEGTRRLPHPGTPFQALASPRGLGRIGRSPLLVVSSTRLITPLGPSRGLAAFRDRLARSLLDAAGTDAARIRAAELAAALTLGRRDLVPRIRRDRWRDSGLAHVLAVSGLHVGVLAGVLWLVLRLFGTRPNTARLVLIVLLPLYALLAGSSPSVLRAVLMGELYLLARLLGRSLLPLGAVVTAAVILLFIEPTLLLHPGFQLTVLITAALLRWVPPFAERLRGPRWLRAAVAVPIVAQAAALPLVAWHFRTLIPAAALVNVAVLPLLAPLLVTAVAAAVAAAAWAFLGGVLLHAVHALGSMVLAIAEPARSTAITVPEPPALLIVLVLLTGLTALWPGRIGTRSLAACATSLALFAAWWIVRPGPAPGSVTLLPVADGTAVLARSERTTLLVDGGRWSAQADQLLADAGVGRIDFVVASHTDDDHLGGLLEVVRRRRGGWLLFPRWMLAEPGFVALLRAARTSRRCTLPVTAGLSVSHHDLAADVLWPPVEPPLGSDNDRSLVARLRLRHGTVLTTGDTTVRSERRYAPSPLVASDVLIVPHHGSRTSTSSQLLERVDPTAALVPAGPAERFGHPHAEVIDRLRRRGIPYRISKLDPWCRAVLGDDRWRLLP